MSSTGPAPPLKRKSSGLAVLVHMLRIGVLALILLLMHWQHAQLLAAKNAAGLHSVTLEQIRSLFPEATSLGVPEQHGGLTVLKDEELLGFVLQTSPQGDRYLGFSGPTNTLIGFDSRERIIGLGILASLDTRDHVGLIRHDPRFLQSLNGMDVAQARGARVDAVTGATLTSLAILQSVQARLGQHPESLKFPQAYTLAEARRFFPQAEKLTQDELAPELWRVDGPKQVPLGWLLSNSPGGDETVGYQGPTRAFLGMRMDGKILGLVVQESFDNDPYVGYVRGDEWFSEVFNEKPLEAWAKTHWEDAGIDGVSGATMTSQAVAQSLLEAARQISQLREKATQASRQQAANRWKTIATASFILLGLLLSQTHWRHVTWLRRTFQVLLIAVMGFINGDLLSMAMFVGWAQSGVPFKNALGLILLSAAALLLPIFLK